MDEKAIRAALMTAKGVKARPTIGDSAAENIADYVAEMLREGRASEITNDLMAQADPQRLWKHYTTGNTGKDMPMDLASRMARAKEMGLTDNTLHGTPYADIKAFRPSEFGSVGPGVYVSKRPVTASDYARGYGLMNPKDTFEQDGERYTVGGNMMPLVTPENLQPFKDWTDEKMADMQRQGLHASSFRADEAAMNAAKNAGYSGVQGRNENAAIFEPQNIRSQFARFDPRLAHLSDLNAASGGAILDKRHHAEAVERAQGQIAPSKYLPNVPRQVHADGGVADDDGNQPIDLGAAREQKQLQTFHKGMMSDMSNRMSQAMEAHQKAVDAGVFDGYEVGDVLQGKSAPLKITGRYVQKWKPSTTTLAHFDRMGAKPTIIEHEGQQYIPMLRYTSGSEESGDNQEGTVYLDGVRAAGYRKMGGLRAVKAKGGSVGARADFVAGNHPDVPPVVYHATKADFHEFRPLSHFGTAQAAHDRFNDKWHPAHLETSRDTHGVNVMPVHISLKNPLDVGPERDWQSNRDTLRQVADAMFKSGRMDQEYLKAAEKIYDLVDDKRWGSDPRAAEQRGADLLREAGHDGIVYTNRIEDPGSRSFVTLGPEQVKSSIGNRGTFDPTHPDMTYAAGGYVPQKTVKAYKLFRKRGDNLLPLFVNADKPVEMGKWLEAEEGPQGKAQGKVKSKLGDLAYRPGWHAGDLPIATHIGGKSSNDLKKPDYRPDDQVWAEVEMAADKDWQSVADSRGKGVKAHITDQVPLKGFYRYKTNPNMTGNWLIGGHMKVNRVLSDDEVKQINDAAGTADLPRLKRADGGPAMFEGMHEDLQNEDGTPMDLWHGTPADKEFEAFDDSKLGSRDAGFFGRGHYLTPERGNAEGYADPDEMGRGTVMGPLHAALKNPYIWDTSSDNAAHRTLRDLQSMGIMRGQGKLEPWDIIQRHDMDTFMRHMQDRGHDGVIVRTHDHTGERPHRVSEVVVFKPNMIKHKDAEVFDPTDPRIRRADGGRLSLYSKAAKIVRGMKNQKMDVKDILKYAEGKGAKRAELDHVDVPPGKWTPSQAADYIEMYQPQIGVKRLGSQDFRFGDSQAYLDELDRLNNRGRHDEAERLYDEFERFEGYGGDQEPKYARYQLPGGDNYREHILTLDSHSHNDPYYAKAHWGNTPNPLAHVRMSDRYDMYPSQPLVDLLNKAQASSQARDVPTQLEHGVAEGIMSAEEAATIAKRLDLKSSGFYGKPDLDKKILHIEEMQSDWNNDARRKGFRTGTEQEDYQKYVDKMRDEAVSGIDPTASPSIRDALRAKYNTMDPYMLALKMGRQSEHNELARRASGDLGVPQAPYVNPKRDDAMELAMKHVLTEAAKGGYTGIAFTPDEAQKERWGGTEFNGIYNKKLPGIAERLVRQHDTDYGSSDAMRIGNYVAPVIPLSPEASDSINQNGFSSFRRGGYVTHVRRAR